MNISSLGVFGIHSDAETQRKADVQIVFLNTGLAKIPVSLPIPERSRIV